ncbi:MAG: hypothetical protein IJS28_00350 [Synergistaceae bacterium]|nr:hypothetical protein [Synergistaceae bacterium]
MKSYTKPEVIDAQNDRGRAFPAVGLAVATGYLAGKAATALGKAFDATRISMNVAVPECVIA